MRDFVEARFDVTLDHPLIGAAGQVVDLGDGVLGSASGAEAIGTWLKVRLEDRLSATDFGCSATLGNGR
jgi:hypothetical protein